ncbi:hypothetical protein FXO37_24295 [Capsicum annuum]|nr:hypothetical protein FXO37_24295 [Capsicum annuum]
MARGNKCKATEGDRSKRRKKRAVDQLENRHCIEETVEASVRDELEKIDPLEARIDEEALILSHSARFFSAERYDLAIVLDDVGSFSAKISIRSRLKMFSEFKQVVVDQCLKSRFKNSCFDGLWDLPEHMKLACFVLKEFVLITSLNYGRYPRDSRYVKAMEEGEAFFKKIVKKRSVNAKILLKLIRGGRLGVTVITSSEDGKDRYDDQDLGGNAVSKHVTRGAGTSEQVQCRYSAERVGRDDSGIKEALLGVASLEHTFINVDEVMIPEVAAAVEKENLDEGDEGKEEEKIKKLFVKKKTKLMDQLVWRRRIMTKADRMKMIKMKKVIMRKKTMKEMERKQKRRMHKK